MRDMKYDCGDLMDGLLDVGQECKTDEMSSCYIDLFLEEFDLFGLGESLLQKVDECFSKGLFYEAKRSVCDLYEKIQNGTVTEADFKEELEFLTFALEGARKLEQRLCNITKRAL